MIVVEDLSCFKKTDAMLLFVLTSFLRIPLEYQHFGCDSSLGQPSFTRPSCKPLNG